MWGLVAEENKNEIASAYLIKIENIFCNRPRNDEESAGTEKNLKHQSVRHCEACRSEYKKFLAC